MTLPTGNHAGAGGRAMLGAIGLVAGMIAAPPPTPAPPDSVFDVHHYRRAEYLFGPVEWLLSRGPVTHSVRKASRGDLPFDDDAMVVVDRRCSGVGPAAS